MPRPSKAARIDQEKTLRAQGYPYKEIAAIVGTSKMNVWNDLSKGEIKAELEQMQREFLADNLPVAKEIVSRIIQNGEVVSAQRYKACERVMESAGMLPSMVTSVFIQNLNQVNFFQSDAVKAVIGKYAQTLLDWNKGDKKKEEVVDV